jgi:hypothetical protein
MTGNKTSHIAVSYKSNGYDITDTYAVSEDSLRDALFWANDAANSATGQNLAQWFAKQGCKVDSFEGKPARVLRGPDCSTEEYYYRDGKKHREDGPAVLYRDADGTTAREEFYLNDIKVKKERFSSLTEIPGVTVERPVSKTPAKPDAPAPA